VSGGYQIVAWILGVVVVGAGLAAGEPQIVGAGIGVWITGVLDEYRRENGGLGMCNTGSGKRIVCAMGGSGCDVDHVAIARGNLKWWRSLRRWVTRRGDLEAYEGATADGDHWVEVAEI
jgi:hypothetical protein